VDQLQLFERRVTRREQVRVLDESGRADEVHRKLDANRLQRVLIREPMLHQLIAVNERNRSGHGTLP